MLKRKMSLLLMALLLIFSTHSIASADVSYLGPAGTYTEEATIKYFGENERILPFKTVAEAVGQVLSGNTDYAVVPVENTIGGPVYPYLDLVMEENNIVIVGEITLPIRQTLLALPGAGLSDIKTVLSHPQGIAQSTDWLKANLPGAKVVEVPSTAEGAKRVAEGGDKSVAAIAASRTSVVYQLDILANDLQYSNDNATRFLVVTTKDKSLIKGNKASLAVTGDVQMLPKLLGAFEKQGLRIVTIHDRPAKTMLGQYTFFIEVATKNIKDSLLGQLAAIARQQQGIFSIKVLGVYDQSNKQN